MANCMIGFQNNVLTAALSAGSKATGLGEQQWQIPTGAASTAWQTDNVMTSAGGAWMLIDTGSTLSVWGALGLFRTNFTAAATVRWRVSNNSDLSSPTFDSGTVQAAVVAGYQQSVVVVEQVLGEALVTDDGREMFFDQGGQAFVDVGGTITEIVQSVQGRYCRVDIDDPNNPDGFINVPLAFAGPVWQPIGNLDFNTTMGRDDQTDVTVSRGGQEYAQPLWSRRRCNMGFSSIRNSEVWPQVMALDAFARATAGNVLLIPDPFSPTILQECVFGRLVSQGDLTYPYQGADRRGWKANITERL